MDSLNENEIHASEIKYELPLNAAKRIPVRTGAVLFTAYGCALAERQTTSGMFVYTVINLTTGKSEILSRRKNQLSENGYKDMAAKISGLLIRGDGLRNVDKKPGESMKQEDLTKTLRFIFTDILPLYGYAVREKQIELAEHILAVTEQRGITLAESEVGTGKTHAYVIAAVLAKRGRLNDFWMRGRYTRQSWAESAYMPAVISTSSIALQNAIVKD